MKSIWILTMKNGEVVEWIEKNDRGWYDCIAVKYMENGRKYWLAKIEFHC